MRDGFHGNEFHRKSELCRRRLVGNRAVFAFYVSVVSYLVATIAIDYWLRMSGLGVGAARQGVTWLTAIEPSHRIEVRLTNT